MGKFFAGKNVKDPHEAQQLIAKSAREVPGKDPEIYGWLTKSGGVPANNADQEDTRAIKLSTGWMRGHHGDLRIDKEGDKIYANTDKERIRVHPADKVDAPKDGSALSGHTYNVKP